MRFNGGMVAVILILLAFTFFVAIPAAAVVMAIGSKARDEKGRKAALANPDAILDAEFVAESVTMKVGPRTLPYESVVLGAKARGYQLIGENAEPGERKTLVFTRASA